MSTLAESILHSPQITIDQISYAKELLKQAESQNQQSGDSDQKAKLLKTYGIYYIKIGEFNKARQKLEASIALYNALARFNKVQETAQILKNLDENFD